MPRVNWCQTTAQRQRINATAFLSLVETARECAGVTPQELCRKVGWSMATYMRRKANPQDLQVHEIQALADILDLGKFPGINDAFLRLLT